MSQSIRRTPFITKHRGTLLIYTFKNFLIYIGGMSIIPDERVDLTGNGLSLKFNFFIQNMKIQDGLPVGYWNLIRSNTRLLHNNKSAIKFIA